MVTAIFTGNKNASARDVWQYDYGQMLRIQGLKLPNTVEIHFSLQETGGTAAMRVGVTKDGVTDVLIPDSMLENSDTTMDYPIFAFIYLTDAASGQTEYKIKIYVKSRPKPEAPGGTGEPDPFHAAVQAVKDVAQEIITERNQIEQNKRDISGLSTSFNQHINNHPSGGSGAVNPQDIEKAVNDYMTKNPVKVTETDPTVPQWAKEPTKPTYIASEVGALADTTVIPTKLADLTEDATHRVVTDAEKQSWSGKAEKSDIPDVINFATKTELGNKADKTEIANLATKTDLNSKANQSELDTVKQNLNGFVKSDQGVQNANKVLEVGADGMVVPTDKPTIPTKLPNPQPIKFTGGVVAEYDGSGAVTIQIPSASGSADVERIEKLATDTSVELAENKLYIFPEMASLTYTLKAPSKANVANEYHFVFKSGTSATQLVHAVGVNIGTFKVEANKIYEISIMENLLTSQSWAVM